MTKVYGGGDGKVVIGFPQRPKPRGNTLTVVHPPLGGCQHRMAEIDMQLAELVCGDCKAKLNPYEFLRRLAMHEIQWGWQKEAFDKAAANLDERSRCSCEHCGKSTRIRRIGKRELARIKGQESS